MKNTLKIQFAIILVISLCFGGLGFFADTDELSAVPAAVLASPEAPQARPMPVLARPLSYNFLQKTELSLQGTDMARYLSVQNFKIQMAAGYAESLQGPVAAPVLSGRNESPIAALKVRPVHLAVKISGPGSAAFGIWGAGQPVPESPPVGQAVVPALALIFLFMETKQLRHSQRVTAGTRDRGVFALSSLFKTNSIMRC